MNRAGQDRFPSLRRRLVNEINKCGVDSIGTFWGGKAGAYEIQQNPDEFARLCLLLGCFEPFQCSLEIGVAQGGAFRFLREQVEIRESYIIDNGEHPLAGVWQRNKQGFINKENEFRGDSHSDECAQWLHTKETNFDLVLIDGDHSYSGVKQDWELVIRYLQPGAIVWFHDIHDHPRHEGVPKFWREIKQLPEVSILFESPAPPTGGRIGVGAFIWKRIYST